MELLQCHNESACTLESFCVYDCLSFTAIPQWLSNHTCLREIHLIQCPNLSSIPQGIWSLTTLKELRIEHCGELSKRCEPQTGEVRHKIAHIPQIKLDLIKIQRTDVRVRPSIILSLHFFFVLRYNIAIYWDSFLILFFLTSSLTMHYAHNIDIYL